MKVVLGLNYGDEGKGLTTSYLCSQTENPLVVRFNGGQQAGHTVNHNGHRHVFSSFGAGTLQGVPTYWSEYCTFDPIAFMNEYRSLPLKPEIFVNDFCPVTTPYDVMANRLGSYVSNGTVGAGFGSTIQRQENHYKLYAKDLFYESVLVAKLNNIADYYGVHNAILKAEYVDQFLEAARAVIKLIQYSDDQILVNRGYEPIFEGAQGILLDQDFGFFPNVTRSNTTSLNVRKLTHGLGSEVYYVTRSYLTRHGNGYMPNENKIKLINNENETNVSHEFQGEFRIGNLDYSLMNYAIDCDKIVSGKYNNHTSNLVITCMDQYEIDVAELLSNISTDFKKVFISKGDSLEDVEQII